MNAPFVPPRPQQTRGRDASWGGRLGHRGHGRCWRGDPEAPLLRRSPPRLGTADGTPARTPAARRGAEWARKAGLGGEVEAAAGPPWPLPSSESGRRSAADLSAPSPTEPRRGRAAAPARPPLGADPDGRSRAGAAGPGREAEAALPAAEVGEPGAAVGGAAGEAFACARVAGLRPGSGAGPRPPRGRRVGPGRAGSVRDRCPRRAQPPAGSGAKRPGVVLAAHPAVPLVRSERGKTPSGALLLHPPAFHQVFCSAQQNVWRAVSDLLVSLVLTPPCPLQQALNSGTVIPGPFTLSVSDGAKGARCGHYPVPLPSPHRYHHRLFILPSFLFPWSQP